MLTPLHQLAATVVRGATGRASGIAGAPHLARLPSRCSPVARPLGGLRETRRRDGNGDRQGSHWVALPQPYARGVRDDPTTPPPTQTAPALRPRCHAQGLRPIDHGRPAGRDERRGALLIDDRPRGQHVPRTHQNPQKETGTAQNAFQSHHLAHQAHRLSLIHI